MARNRKKEEEIIKEIRGCNEGALFGIYKEYKQSFIGYCLNKHYFNNTKDDSQLIVSIYGSSVSYS